MQNNNPYIILSIVPAPLLPAVSGGQKATYGPLFALGKIANLISITDTKSSTENHSFKLLPLIKHEAVKYFALKNLRMLLKQVETIKPCSILLEQPFMGPIVSLVSAKTKVPFFIHSHNIEYLRFKSLGKYWWPILYFIEKHTFKRAKGIFFITNHDRDLAIRRLGVDKQKCFIAPYGIPQEKVVETTPENRAKVRKRHNIAADETVFMFFGVLKYMPNIEALELIIEKVMPRLIKKYDHKFKILVCGAGISSAYKKQLEQLDPEHFIYAGFVDNIDEYTQSADIILNPVLSGGGIKTKIVEALGFNKNVVSTKTGAIGVDATICGSKLYISDDHDWDAFTNNAIKAVENKAQIPTSFFEVFSLKSIAQNMYATLTQGRPQL